MSVKVCIHHDDLPDNVMSKIKDYVAIDTEAMGLQYNRDRLCLVQLCSVDGICHLVKISKKVKPAPNLMKLLKDKNIVKLFHYARFDVGILYYTYRVMCNNIYCTKIASRLCRTYSDRHGLRELCRTMLKIDLIKQEQASDWGNETLSDAQKAYAAKDVLHLNALRQELNPVLKREDREKLFQECCDFIPTRVKLDVEGWNDVDIFAHH